MGLVAGEQTEVRAPESEGRAEDLALADHHVGPPLPRRAQDAGGYRIGRHHQYRSAPVTEVASGTDVLQASEVVRVAHEEHAGHVFAR